MVRLCISRVCNAKVNLSISDDVMCSHSIQYTNLMSMTALNNATEMSESMNLIKVRGG